MSAPRLVTRALVTSFLTVALVLGAVFAVLSLRVRDQVRQSVADNLSSAQQVFTRVEARRQQDMRASVAILAENPTLKAALDTWLTERKNANAETSAELLATVQREADKIAGRVAADVLAVVDGSRRVVASGGRLASAWPRGMAVGDIADDASPTDGAVSVGSGMYHVVSVPLQVGDATVGSLELGTALDARYARELADLSRGDAAILSKGVVLASTVNGPAARDLATLEGSDAPDARTVTHTYPQGGNVNGQLLVTGDGTHTTGLSVGTIPLSILPCAGDAKTLCLNGGRFKVRVDWKSPESSGFGTAVPVTTDTGEFWFLSANNIELVIKVVDGSSLNGHFWVFYGALSNLEYTITITDTTTGAVKTYHNPQGTTASVADVSAF